MYRTTATLVVIAAGVIVSLPGVTQGEVGESADDSAVSKLAAEVRGMGWIAYSARSEKGDWDVFLCRPDGSDVRNITRTADNNEFAPQFSRDGRRLLYRRVAKGDVIDNNQFGTQGQLVLAQGDGSGAEAFGEPGEYPWASWSPDGKQLATLSIPGIALVDVATKQILRTMPRKGFFQQLTWSPDGKWLCGVANSFGAGWSVGRIEVATGTTNAVSVADCCTPDWFPDNKSLVYSSRPPGQKTNNGYGWTRLCVADVEGKSRRLVYGEDGRHVYGGCISPDGKYVLFTGNMQENGDPGHAGSPMGLMRLADAPIIVGKSESLRREYPKTNSGPVLVLQSGWEPCWTQHEPSAVGRAR